MNTQAHREANRRYRLRHKEERREHNNLINREWHAANGKSRAAEQREYRKRNPEKVREYDKCAHEKRKDGKRKVYNAATWLKFKETRTQAQMDHINAQKRRSAAKKLGYAECTEYPPTPSDNRCAICSRTGKLVLDHDHATGAFRGYICRDCNMGLGKLGDNLDSLMRAIAYLRGRDEI